MASQLIYGYFILRVYGIPPIVHNIYIIYVVFEFFQASICPIDGILTYTNTLGQCFPRINGNEGVVHTPQTFITGPSPSDSFQCYNQDISFCEVSLLCKEAFSILLAPPTFGLQKKDTCVTFCPILLRLDK